MGIVEQHHRDARLVGRRGEHSSGGVEQLGEDQRIEHVAAQSSEGPGRHEVGDCSRRATASVERSAVARNTRRPAALATSRHSSASRVLPTPGGPYTQKPSHPGSANARPEGVQLVTTAHERPTSCYGHTVASLRLGRSRDFVEHELSVGQERSTFVPIGGQSGTKGLNS